MSININAANQFSKTGQVMGGSDVAQLKNANTGVENKTEVLSTEALLAATGANEVKGAKSASSVFETSGKIAFNGKDDANE